VHCPCIKERREKTEFRYNNQLQLKEKACTTKTEPETSAREKKHRGCKPQAKTQEQKKNKKAQPGRCRTKNAAAYSEKAC
jgi:hypothetical protein